MTVDQSDRQCLHQRQLVGQAFLPDGLILSRGRHSAHSSLDRRCWPSAPSPDHRKVVKATHRSPVLQFHSLLSTLRVGAAFPDMWLHIEFGLCLRSAKFVRRSVGSSVCRCFVPAAYHTVVTSLMELSCLTILCVCWPR